MEFGYLLESFRSEVGTFDQNFADYLICRRKEGFHHKTCPFFLDDKKERKWASSLFE